MKTRTFTPSWLFMSEQGAQKATEKEIKDEPMLFNCGTDFAMYNGGPLTKEFLRRLAATVPLADAIIDSRVHMLKPGWYPCIPGWHIDDFWRPTNAQPDLDTAPKNQRHYMAILGDASKTEFIDGNVTLQDEPPSDMNLFEYYDWQLNTMKDLTIIPVNEGTIYGFGNTDLHRGTAATKAGWRFFIRATTNSARIPTNEIRKQTQVYLPLGLGW